MFPRGEDGWHPNIPIHDSDEDISEISGEDERNERNVSNKCVTAMNYFAYQLQVSCSEEISTLHWYGRLFQ